LTKLYATAREEKHISFGYVRKWRARDGDQLSCLEEKIERNFLRLIGKFAFFSFLPLKKVSSFTLPSFNELKGRKISAIT
jgi:hypothetical protein